MIGSLARKIFGSANDRYIKKQYKVVERINALEPEISALTDEQLRAKTDEFKNRIKQGETLDELLPEAFAVVREAAKRTLGQRHYDVQLIGGIVLHHGQIAEMKTGEGKTLVATLAAYLNALDGKGVHIVTVNDYLAKRDAEWMGQVYRFLGLTVDYIVHEKDDDQRRHARRGIDLRSNGHVVEIRVAVKKDVEHAVEQLVRAVKHEKPDTERRERAVEIVQKT